MGCEGGVMRIKYLLGKLRIMDIIWVLSLFNETLEVQCFVTKMSRNTLIREN